jgi:hypothetical protein
VDRLDGCDRQRIFHAEDEHADCHTDHPIAGTATPPPTT